MGLVDSIMQAIMSNPEIQKKANETEETRNYFNILQSGDQSRGEAAAMEIIGKLGISKEQAIQQAQQGLSQMFGNLGRR